MGFIFVFINEMYFCCFVYTSFPAHSFMACSMVAVAADNFCCIQLTGSYHSDVRLIFMQISKGYHLCMQILKGTNYTADRL